MRLISTSLLLLLSTQAFGISSQVSRAGARLASQALRSNLRPNTHQLAKRPLEAFALQARGLATDNKKLVKHQKQI